MTHEPTPDTAATPRDLGTLAFRTLVAGGVGLVTTATLAFALGWLLLGHRDSWHEGQGEGFVTTVFSVYAAPIGGLYWALVYLLHALVLAARVGPTGRRRALVLATAGFVVTLAGGFVSLVAQG